MPYEKNLKVKHLKVKESQKFPTKVLTCNTVLYGEDSGKTLTVPVLVGDIDVTIPSAEVGRTLKVIINANGNASAGKLVRLHTKNCDERFNGKLLTISTQATPTDYQKSFDGSTVVTQLSIGTGSDLPLTGSVVDLVCLTKGVWTASGYGITAGSASVFA